ncbi:MAG: tRNA(Ile)-lysidine synthase [Gammaproteobacteria bacterium]|nr:MAG: tRNA(Ile)-lysidine synthase [Gammaproteobacteria bacterium]
MFVPDNLRDINLENYSRIAVAFSGGLDSSVLLHSLVSIPEFKEKVFAIHVNHGLSPNSKSWIKHCDKFCSGLGVNFIPLTIELENSKTNENILRKARYEALFSCLKQGDVLCTAHHQDDHIETILFRILRGTGIKGLAGIEKYSQMEGIDLIRPLISYSKKDLLDYADKFEVNWIEDESNEDLSISRNFIRKKVIPNLKNDNWPEYKNSISYLSSKAKEANEILDEIAYLDLKLCASESLDRLSILKIKELSHARAMNVLFTWLGINTHLGVSNKLTDQVYKSIILASESSNPVVTFGKKGQKGSFQIRRFNNFLHHLPLTETETLSNKKVWKWNSDDPLELPTGTLSMQVALGKGISTQLTEPGISIKGRIGGERCKPEGRSKSQKLKKLFQEYGVPPWVRDRIPLVYVGDQLAAVSDLWVCDEFVAKKDERGIVLSWTDSIDNQ